MLVSNGRLGPPSEHKFQPGIYVGGAWMDWILDIDNRNLRVVTVVHDPGARTCWHTHTGGQIIICLAGEGRVGSKRDGIVTVRSLPAGDAVYFEPGELHFQAASPNRYTLEIGFVVGAGTYYELPTDEEYAGVEESSRRV